MLGFFARLAIQRSRKVLLAALFALVVCGIFGSTAVAHLSSGGFDDPNSPSSRADTLLAQDFGQGTPNFLLLVQSSSALNSPATTRAGLLLTTRLRTERYIADVVSYWSAPRWAQSSLESKNGHAALVVARVLGNDNVSPTRAAAIAARFTGTKGSITVRAGGQAIIYDQISVQISHDLAIAELVAVPLTMIVLVLVFGSLVAALLPLAVGGVAIVGTLAVLRALTVITPVSIYALNLTTAMGLGLAIDYSLFILSRYREEVRSGRTGPEAIEVALHSAGRTVLFSSLTVALSMAALIVFPFYFLRSFAYAGLCVVAIAALGAVLVLPALLMMIGERVNALDLRVGLRRLFRRPVPRTARSEGRFWRGLALLVMRRPVLMGACVVVFLVVLGIPFLSVRFGLPDDRVLPASASSHQVAEDVRAQFNQDSANELTAMIPNLQHASEGGLSDYAKQLSRVGGVTAVLSPHGTFVRGALIAPTSTQVSGVATYLDIENNVEPYSNAGTQLVATVKRVPAPAPVLLTGSAAENIDALHALGAVLPLAIGLIAAATFVLLFLFTGSILVPVKALVLNTLSLSATFGAMVWVFQEGHLSALFGRVLTTGYLSATMPVLMFCIAFGLSMDYEVFLLSRIKEEWDHSDHSAQANTAAVAKGLERTGRIVTAAAALISIVFIAVATSEVSFIRMFGTGMALAVLVDATLVRGILVPAFMRLAGRANWWAPARMARWRARWTITEEKPFILAKTEHNEAV